MNATDYWQFFMETGAPEYYLMYQKALKMEATNVLDDPGHRAQSNRLQ